MEELQKQEIIKNTTLLQKEANNFTPSYKDSMKSALKQFEIMGIPSKKDEDWKYTSIAKSLSSRAFNGKESIIHDLPKFILDKRGYLIFNNGVFNKFQSVLPAGLELSSLLNQEKFFDSFDALNYASALSAISFIIKKNTQIDFPISIIHLVDDIGVNKMINPRINFIAEPQSKMTFVEIFTSTQIELFQYTTNSSINFMLQPNSKIEHIKIQNEATNSVHVGLTQARLKKDASFKSITIDFGLLKARHNINVDLIENGSEAAVHGLFALKNTEHTDIFSIIHHHAGMTTSEQLFKGIVSGNAHGIFTGKIIIEKDAQLVSSSQLNKNLLLSKKAHIDTRPQLLVHADDVKCSHGATIGQLSPDEEFYLESRGIPSVRAKKMLCHGFAMDVLFKIDNESIRKMCEQLLVEHFEKTALSDNNL